MYSTAGLSIPSSWLVIFPSNIQTIVLCRVWKYQFLNWNLRQFNTIIMPHISCSELYFETYWQMCMCFVTDFIFLVWVFFDTYFVMFSRSHSIRVHLNYNIYMLRTTGDVIQDSCDNFINLIKIHQNRMSTLTSIILGACVRS